MKMKMKIDKILIITTVICFLPVILSLMLYNQLPNQIAVHWDIAGNSDTYVSKAFATFLNFNKLPILLVILAALIGIPTVYSYLLYKKSL
ncbi:MAG: DUF1648 domain-containing protein [Sedimentibacter sp.]